MINFRHHGSYFSHVGLFLELMSKTFFTEAISAFSPASYLHNRGDLRFTSAGLTSGFAAGGVDIIGQQIT